MNANAAGNGANSDITSLSGLTTPLSVPQGGTGRNTLASGNLLTGNGTGGITSIPQSTFGAATGPSAWTPADASGASVPLTNNGCFYYQVGKLVVLVFDVTYGATGSGAQAEISGLPATPDVAIGPAAFEGIVSGPTLSFAIAINGSGHFIFLQAGTNSPFANSGLANARIRGTISYFTA